MLFLFLLATISVQRYKYREYYEIIVKTTTFTDRCPSGSEVKNNEET